MLAVEDKSMHLSDAIENATQHIIENEVPLCDYVAVKDSHESQPIRFREAVQRLNLIRKSEQGRNFKLLDVLEFIKDKKNADSKPNFLSKLLELKKQVAQSQKSDSLGHTQGSFF